MIKLLILKKKTNVFGIYWETFVANFGGSSDSSDMRDSYKILTFITLFFGNVVWMGYQASLTVDLTTPIAKLPFRDIEGLIESNWKLLTHSKR